MDLTNIFIDIISEVLHDRGKEYTDELRRRLKEDYDLEESRLIGTLQFDVSGNILTVSMADYAHWVEHGRGAGKFPPRDKIRDWVDRKGLTMDDGSGDPERDAKALTYLISRKISKEGIPPRPFIDPTPEDKIADDIIEKLEGRIITELEL